MRNKSIKQNWKINNHIKIIYINNETFDNLTEADKINQCKLTWEHLCNDELNREKIFVNRGRGFDKHTLSIWTDDKYVYLIAAIRTEYNSDFITIYVNNNTENNINDLISIAKFIHRDIKTMTKDYRQLIIDAKEAQSETVADA